MNAPLIIPEPPSEDELKCKKCGQSWAPEFHYSYWYYNNYRIVCLKDIGNVRDK